MVRLFQHWVLSTLLDICVIATILYIALMCFIFHWDVPGHGVRLLEVRQVKPVSLDDTRQRE